MSVIKQAKKDPNDKEEQKISAAIVKKPGDDLQIVSQEAIMKVNNEVVINEEITINSLFLDETKKHFISYLSCPKRCSYQ